MLVEKPKNINNLKQGDNRPLDDQALEILDDQVLGIFSDQVVDVVSSDDRENDNDKNDLHCKPNERKRKQSTNSTF